MTMGAAAVWRQLAINRRRLAVNGAAVGGLLTAEADGAAGGLEPGRGAAYPAPPQHLWPSGPALALHWGAPVLPRPDQRRRWCELCESRARCMLCLGP